MVYRVKSFDEVDKKNICFFAVVPSRGKYVADCVEGFLASDVPELCRGAYCFYLFQEAF